MVSKFRDVSHKLLRNNSLKPFQFFDVCFTLRGDSYKDLQSLHFPRINIIFIHLW